MNADIIGLSACQNKNRGQNRGHSFAFFIFAPKKTATLAEFQEQKPPHICLGDNKPGQERTL
jgi:hypothetical protein